MRAARMAYPQYACEYSVPTPVHGRAEHLEQSGAGDVLRATLPLLLMLCVPPTSTLFRARLASQGINFPKPASSVVAVQSFKFDMWSDRPDQITVSHPVIH